MSPHSHFDLSALNTFGMKAYADWGCEIDSVAQLATLLADKQWSSLPRLVLGAAICCLPLISTVWYWLTACAASR